MPEDPAGPGWWRPWAACLSASSLFFPISETSETAAKRVCKGCPVRLECLAYAVSTGPDFGIWGGLNPEELRRIRRRHSNLQSLYWGPDAELERLLSPAGSARG